MDKSKEDAIERLKKEVKFFNDERDWSQFHTPSNIAKSISIEANELLECFQWSDTDYSLDSVKEELADVIIYCITMSNVLDLDINSIVEEKIKINREKYPVDKAKGNSKKYNEL